VPDGRSRSPCGSRPATIGWPGSACRPAPA